MQYLKKNSPKLLAIFCLAAVLVLCWKLGMAHDARQPALPENSPFRDPGDLPYLSISSADRDEAPANPHTLELDRLTDPVIAEGGAYTLTGSLDGTLYIRAEDEIVHLILDGASISSKEGPAIWVESAGKVFITLAPGSENHLADSPDYRRIAEAEACLYARCDVTINGTGSLSVFGAYRDGIRTNDVLRILGGSVTVLCKRTGLHGTDGIHIDGGEIQVSSEKNGLRTTKSGADGKGCLVVSGGSLNIIAGRYAFVCDKGSLYLSGCTVREKSVVAMANVGGETHIQEGCLP